MMLFFPHLFTFLPKSYILPLHRQHFEKVLANTTRTMIVKPDGGALGVGIVIVPPQVPYTFTNKLSVAQEYIESYLLDGYKFDFRIYCLVIAGRKKPKIYVYRDGIARFCSMPASEGTTYSQITNTAVNITNQEVTASNITRLVSEVFQHLQKLGVNTSKIWADIQDAVCLSVLSAYAIVQSSLDVKIPSVGYARSFQLLGFDVLLDEQLKPWVLEVNYRPSLDFDTQNERLLKVKLLRDVLQIAAPYAELETTLRSGGKPWTGSSFKRFLQKNREMLKRIKEKRKFAESQSNFIKVFPTDDPGKAEWTEVLKASSQMPTEIGFGYQLPRMVGSIPMMKRELRGVMSSQLPPLYFQRSRNSISG
jgi:hypothetical protein